ncbi:uncharacterized protein LOC135373976 [Ornithodoros turicata]|uniref:uncharacterized protein LOC135373976 n=1 Tax=Ornithodoros turicata TaxID=34597 RepID=UPI003139FB78
MIRRESEAGTLGDYLLMFVCLVAAIGLAVAIRYSWMSDAYTVDESGDNWEEYGEGNEAHGDQSHDPSPDTVYSPATQRMLTTTDTISNFTTSGNDTTLTITRVVTTITVTVTTITSGITLTTTTTTTSTTTDHSVTLLRTPAVPRTPLDWKILSSVLSSEDLCKFSFYQSYVAKAFDLEPLIADIRKAQRQTTCEHTGTCLGMSATSIAAATKEKLMHGFWHTNVCHSFDGRHNATNGIIEAPSIDLPSITPLELFL